MSRDERGYQSPGAATDLDISKPQIRPKQFYLSAGDWGTFTRSCSHVSIGSAVMQTLESAAIHQPTQWVVANVETP